MKKNLQDLSNRIYEREAGKESRHVTLKKGGN